MPPPVDPSGLPRAELEARVVELMGALAELRRIVAAQRDEIARLKGLKGRPSIKPSGMENATEPQRGGKRVNRRYRGRVTPRVTPETEVLRVAHQRGSQFNGYASYQVHHARLRRGRLRCLTARVVRYRRERWLTRRRTNYPQLLHNSLGHDRGVGWWRRGHASCCCRGRIT